MRKYIKYREREIFKKTYQIYCENYMAKYGGLDLYDEDIKKRYIIDNNCINYVNKEGMYLIRILDEPSTDHE